VLWSWGIVGVRLGRVLRGMGSGGGSGVRLCFITFVVHHLKMTRCVSQ
jgi:hypothetical protein